MRCYCKILYIPYKDHVTNEEVCAKIQQDHMETSWPSKRCKLQWYGHVSHSSGLAKIILQGTVKGGRRQGRQRKRWEDNIREWTGLEFGKSQRAVENREKQRKLVAKSSVVPQRPSRFRDWWWWWWWTEWNMTVQKRMKNTSEKPYACTEYSTAVMHHGYWIKETLLQQAGQSSPGCEVCDVALIRSSGLWELKRSDTEE